MVCARGRGAEAASREWREPTFLEVPFQDEPFPAYVIDAETLKDPVLKGMRRADRFSKMATLAACDAVADSGQAVEDSDRVGIIFATALGPHNTTFKFQDDIIDYGDAGVSPTIFSNSVHNAAVSYISRTLKIKGPTWTVTGFENPFEEAVLLAQAWLEEGRCDQVLLGGGDECGTVMEYICSQKLLIATDGRITADAYVPGEGAAFFLVGKGDGNLLAGADEAWTPLFGNMLTGSALACAASLMSEN
ncbi:3-oxoacyl-[acyl-carrier-protein] synthase 2 [Pontiella desulfatans]|uniref:3-oxoacyl-[acyl-carrier-protein] synthase 2 n=1 Tax=Pontiella desulfatans TaxID=2750659 RepID=A0A6C2TXQ5_PONDE|nr:3-oxoacyl-[acyl-carrier-protein] synthase 2 [Pontiella desulfatans]